MGGGVKKGKGRGKAGMLGGAVCIICLLFRLPFLASLLIGIGVFAARMWLFPPKDKGAELVSPGITRAELDAVLTEGAAKVRAIRNAGRLSDKYEIRQEIKGIAQIADAIFADFKRDPKDIKAVRRFLTYYLDATQKIVLKYRELSAGYGKNQETMEILARVEKTLPLIRATYEKILQKTLEDDFLDLDVELQVLETTIKTEGV